MYVNPQFWLAAGCQLTPDIGVHLKNNSSSSISSLITALLLCSIACMKDSGFSLG